MNVLRQNTLNARKGITTPGRLRFRDFHPS